MNNGTFSTDNNSTNGAYTFATGIDSVVSNTGNNWTPRPNPRHRTANVAGKLYEGDVHEKVRRSMRRNELQS